MAAKVEIELLTQHAGKQPGDTLKVDALEARRLVYANIARYPSKAEEKKAESQA